ncbi:unnamed protein product [Amoebophrya sp. A120]|nr:unnamed protein product [Amoebophrya sp. A120]|eukprot:GSA120T00002633001.1
MNRDVFLRAQLQLRNSDGQVRRGLQQLLSNFFLRSGSTGAPGRRPVLLLRRTPSSRLSFARLVSTGTQRSEFGQYGAPAAVQDHGSYRRGRPKERLPGKFEAILREQFGIENPTPIQALAWEQIPARDEHESEAAVDSLSSPEPNLLPDLLLKAATGSGKTLAYLLPLIEKVLRRSSGSGSDVKTRNQNIFAVEALIVCPTRDLVFQVQKTLERLLLYHPEVRFSFLTASGHRSKKSGDFYSCLEIPALDAGCRPGNGSHGAPATASASSISVNGGGGSSSRSGDLTRLRLDCPQILVATPGKLAWHLMNTAGFPSFFQSLHTLVLDEADALLDLSGYFHQISFVVEALRSSKYDPATRNEEDAAFVADKVEMARTLKEEACSYNHCAQPQPQRSDSSSSSAFQTILCSATFAFDREKLAERTLLRPGYRTLDPSDADGQGREERVVENDPASEIKLKSPDDEAVCDSEQVDRQLAATTRDELYHVYEPTNLCLDLVRILEQGSAIKSSHRSRTTVQRSSPPKRALVIFPTRRFLQFFYVLLKHFYQLDADLFALHSALAEDKRRAVVNRFTTTQVSSSGEQNFRRRREILFASDVAGRGLDFCGVDLIVQMGLSFLGPEQYVHRIGRTGRHGNFGQSVLLVNRFEEKTAHFRELTTKNACTNVGVAEVEQEAVLEGRVSESTKRNIENAAGNMSTSGSGGEINCKINMGTTQTKSTTDDPPWWEYEHFYASADLMYKSLLAFFDRQKHELKLSPNDVHDLAFDILKSATRLRGKRKQLPPFSPVDKAHQLPADFFPPKVSRGLAQRLSLAKCPDVRINTNAQRIELLAALPSYPGFQSRSLQDRVVEKRQIVQHQDDFLGAPEAEDCASSLLSRAASA